MSVTMPVIRTPTDARVSFLDNHPIKIR
jgi:hypothetical protein